MDLAPGISRQVAQPLPFRTPSSHHRRDSTSSQGSSNSAAAAAATALDALVPCVRLLVDVLECSTSQPTDSEPDAGGFDVLSGTPVSITLEVGSHCALIGVQFKDVNQQNIQASKLFCETIVLPFRTILDGFDL